MPSFISLLQQGNAWLFVPSAILLGALHGLEPGHSKTMMAAFIVAIHGTVTQAVLLGLSATLSHTAVVWAVAMAGLSFGGRWSAETSEPYFQLISGLLILGVALWMLWRTWRDQHGRHHHHDHGQRRPVAPAVPGKARYRPVSATALVQSGALYVAHEVQDAHERAHAAEIERRFAHRQVTTGQIVLFGLTGGLIPCPASITVLLLCLQLKQLALGGVLVLCFSVGLALTMVASGVLAALSLKHLAGRWRGFGQFARKAPYLSGSLIMLVGLYVSGSGLWQLA